MPAFPEVKTSTAANCNLRQALQWLKDEIKPVDPDFEPITGTPSEIQEREYTKEFAALLSGRLRVFGRPGLAPSQVASDGTVWFPRYGSTEEIPNSKIKAAGIVGINCEENRIQEIVEYVISSETGGVPRSRRLGLYGSALNLSYSRRQREWGGGSSISI
jgi:hypothetical protein